MSDLNLDLDIDWVGHDEDKKQVVRICVASACRFTRDGGASTITADCPDLRTIESEANRLKSEIDTALNKAREHFGGTEAPPPVSTSPRPGTDSVTVADVMTREVKTVDRNDELSLVDELMRVGMFRHVVVTDSDGGIAGVISRSDILHGRLSWSLGVGKSMHDRIIAVTPAKSVMQTDVITTAAGAPLQEAAGLMRTKKVGCLPVLEGATLVGILTEGDLLAFLT